uniref:Uncharacterized protein n=1 Tax=Rhizophora mucronata TaxID=61149 RepID=A0A2P2NCD7_RHIMU
MLGYNPSVNPGATHSRFQA